MDTTPLKPTSIAGACISIMFSFFTVAVLACFRDRCQAVLIKQQFALSIMVTNVIVVVGLQGGLPTIPCRVVTSLLLYSVVASFAWLVKDIAYMVTCIKWQLPLQSFRVVCLITWGLPIPCLAIGILLGELLKSNTGFKLYSCWKSDHIVWAWIAPCLLCVVISFYCVFIVVEKLSDIEKTKEFQKLVYIPAGAIRYNLTTNIIILVLNIIVWVFGALVFYFSENQYFQLMFGLTDATQGLVLFFVYCVFHSREKGIYSLRELKVPANKRTTLRDGRCSPIPEDEKEDTYAFKTTIAPAPDRANADELQEETVIYSNENIVDDAEKSSDNDNMDVIDDALTETITSQVDACVLSVVDACVSSVVDASPSSSRNESDKSRSPVKRRDIHSFEDFINASIIANPDRNNLSSSDEEDGVKNKGLNKTYTGNMSATTSTTRTRTQPLKVTSGLAYPRTAGQSYSRNSAASCSSMNELEILFNNPEILNGHPSRTNLGRGESQIRKPFIPTSYKYLSQGNSYDFVATQNERSNIERILLEHIDPCITPENRFIGERPKKLNNIYTSVQINDTSSAINHPIESNTKNDVIVEVMETEDGKHDETAS